MVSVAISLASSPAAAPPMPSATMRSSPRSPSSYSRSDMGAVQSRRDRSATRKLSSLWSRALPRSLLANTRIVIGFARPTMGLGLSGQIVDEPLIGGARRNQGRRLPCPANRIVFVATSGLLIIECREGVGHDVRRERSVALRDARRVVDVLSGIPDSAGGDRMRIQRAHQVVQQ